MRAGLAPAVAGALDRLPRETAAAAGTVRGELAAFLELLLDENARTNLVSRSAAAPDALADHLADALFGLSFLPPPGGPLRLLDLGSGGGFPAVPLLIVRRDVAGTLVESAGKKCAFLRSAAARLALTASVVNARFPDSFDMTATGPFDVLTTRAVGSAGRLVRAARRVLAPAARALLWTTEPLAAAAARESRALVSAFHRDPRTERRGILVLAGFGGRERST